MFKNYSEYSKKHVHVTYRFSDIVLRQIYSVKLHSSSMMRIAFVSLVALTIMRMCAEELQLNGFIAVFV